MRQRLANEAVEPSRAREKTGHHLTSDGGEGERVDHVAVERAEELSPLAVEALNGALVLFKGVWIAHQHGHVALTVACYLNDQHLLYLA